MRRLSVLLLTFPLLASAPAAFVEHTIANDLKGGYQVVAADLNHDGRPDLIALASGMSELVWYENPGWQRHVLAAGQRRMINCAVVGNEIVLASEFSLQAKDSAGVVSVLRPGAMFFANDDVTPYSTGKQPERQCRSPVNSRHEIRVLLLSEANEQTAAPGSHRALTRSKGSHKLSTGNSWTSQIFLPFVARSSINRVPGRRIPHIGL